MKGGTIEHVVVPDSEPGPYPYPRWSPDELGKLARWYPVIGLKQCADLWFSLTGRKRSVEQLDNKSRRMELQNYIPDDWLGLFREGVIE